MKLPSSCDYWSSIRSSLTFDAAYRLTVFKQVGNHQIIEDPSSLVKRNTSTMIDAIVDKACANDKPTNKSTRPWELRCNATPRRQQLLNATPLALDQVYAKKCCDDPFSLQCLPLTLRWTPFFECSVSLIRSCPSKLPSYVNVQIVLRPISQVELTRKGVPVMAGCYVSCWMHEFETLSLAK